MAEVHLDTVALGYLRAYHRFHDAALATADSDELFIPLHETLGWLYTILERTDVQRLVPSRFASALRFVRSRVHHRWANAVEFRDDVEVEPFLLGLGAGARPVFFVDGTVYSAWCWRKASDLPAGDRGRRAAYVAELGGRPVHTALHVFADLLYTMTDLDTAFVVGSSAHVEARRRHA